MGLQWQCLFLKNPSSNYSSSDVTKNEKALFKKQTTVTRHNKGILIPFWTDMRVWQHSAQSLCINAKIQKPHTHAHFCKTQTLCSQRTQWMNKLISMHLPQQQNAKSIKNNSVFFIECFFYTKKKINTHTWMSMMEQSHVKTFYLVVTQELRSITTLLFWNTF